MFILQSLQILSSLAKDPFLEYLPVSIKRLWALILNLHIAFRKWNCCRSNYGSLQKSVLKLKYVSSFPSTIFFSLSCLQNDLNFFVKVLLTIFINWISPKFLQAKILRFSNSNIYISEVYQVWMPFSCNSFDKSYASSSNPSFKFSNLYKYFTIERIMENTLENDRFQTEQLN